MELRDLFRREPHHKDNPTLQDLVATNPPVAMPDDVDLHNVYARLPGDDTHPLWTPNPYMAMSYADVKQLSTSRDLTSEQQRLVLEALTWMRS